MDDNGSKFVNTCKKQFFEAENDTLELLCLVKNAFPKPEKVWWEVG
jgi:hypothetical protein